MCTSGFVWRLFNKSRYTTTAGPFITLFIYLFIGTRYDNIGFIYFYRSFEDEVLDYEVHKDFENMERSECFRMNSVDHIGIEVADVGTVV